MQGPTTPLVTPLWIAERRADPNTILVDATLPPPGTRPSLTPRERYLEKHLPGAVFFDIEELCDHSTQLPHMLPKPEIFAQSVSALGIGSDMNIVVYEQSGVFSAPRAWWMLRTMGASHVYILDGGLDAWIAAGYPLQSGEVQRPPATFYATLDPKAVINFDQIQQLIAGNAQILDARSSGRFHGTAPEPRPGLPSGHMPGATSVPYTELAENGRLKSTEALRQIFHEKGVALDKPITTTCGSGVTAAVIALGLEIAGAKQVSLYDGSWAEYAQRPEAVIEKEE